MHWKWVEIFLNAMVRFGVPNRTIALGNILDQFPNGMIRFGTPTRTIAFRKNWSPFGDPVWVFRGVRLGSFGDRFGEHVGGEM